MQVFNSHLQQGIYVRAVLRHDLLDIPAHCAHLLQDYVIGHTVAGHNTVDRLSHFTGHLDSLKQNVINEWDELRTF